MLTFESSLFLSFTFLTVFYIYIGADTHKYNCKHVEMLIKKILTKFDFLLQHISQEPNDSSSQTDKQAVKYLFSSLQKMMT